MSYTSPRAWGAFSGKPYGSFAGKTAILIAGTTGSVWYLPLRLASGQWAASGVTASADLTNLRSWLPGQRTPIGYANGQPIYMDPTWWRFLHFVAETKLGGADAETIPDIVAAVVETLTQSATAAATVVAVAQQSQANADSLAATVQVVQTAALAGATQIPPVQSGTAIP